LTINSVDRSGDIDPATVRIEDKLNSEINTASFDMTCVLAAKPSAGQEVIFYDDVAKEFGGVIIKAPETELLDDVNLHYSVECYDHQHTFDKRLVVATYEDEYAGDIIADFVGTNCPGFTVINVKKGPKIGAVSFNRLHPSECMEKLKRITGYSWYIDEDKDVHFFDREANAASWNIDDTGGNFEGLEITPDRSQLCTRVTVLGGMARSTSTVPERLTTNSVNRVWNLTYKPHDIAVTLNGAPQTIGIANIHTSGYDFYLDYQQQILIQDASATVLGAADELDTEYYYDTPVRIVMDDPAGIAAVIAIEGGDGIYEHVIEDDSVRDKLTGRKFAKAYLAEHGNVPLYAKYQTSTAGLRSGQLQRIVRTRRGIDQYFLITSVIKWLEGGEWKYEVEASSTLKPMTLQKLLMMMLGVEAMEENDSEIVDIIQVFSQKLGLRTTINAYPHEFNMCATTTFAAGGLKT
jgi:hypothetical protein